MFYNPVQSVRDSRPFDKEASDRFIVLIDGAVKQCLLAVAWPFGPEVDITLVVNLHTQKTAQ